MQFSCCFFSLIFFLFSHLFSQDQGTGALVISSLLDFLTFALCAPYSETTEGQQFDMLLEMAASNGRTLFKLFQVRRPKLEILRIFYCFICFAFEVILIYLNYISSILLWQS